MLVEIVCALLSVVVLMLAMVMQPRVATCPTGWYMGEGVRTTGSFACVAPLPRGCGAAAGPMIPCPRQPKLLGRIYCTGGSRPIVVDWRTVGCSR